LINTVVDPERAALSAYIAFILHLPTASWHQLLSARSGLFSSKFQPARPMFCVIDASSSAALFRSIVAVGCLSPLAAERASVNAHLC